MIEKVDELWHRPVAVGVIALIAVSRQPALPVRGKQAKSFPALCLPRIRHLASFEHDMLDRPLAKTAAHRQAGVSGAEHDGIDDTSGSHVAGSSVHLDAYVRRVRYDVKYSRALLRLGDQSLDLVGSSVGIDLVLYLDAVKSVSHIPVDAEDTLYVHGAFDRGRDGAQLDSAVLCNSRNAGCQATRQADQDVFDRGRSIIFGSKYFGVIGLEGEFRSMFLLRTKPKKAAYGRLAVGPADPLAGRTPFELGSFGRNGKRIARVEQRLNVDTVVDLFLKRKHIRAPGLDEMTCTFDDR